MSVDPACSHSSCSEEPSDPEDMSPMPVIYGSEENYFSLQISSTEMHHTETASLPSSVDLPVQDSPDSSTSPKLELPGSSSEEGMGKRGESKIQVKKQKVRTVFSQAQLCVLNQRFQKQKYLSLQQMQELSSSLDLSYKQVKTWFQNQRMKYKRWQKNNWSKTSHSVTQGSTCIEYPGLHSSCLPGFLVNPSGNLPVWSNQTWNNPAWSGQNWSSHSWSTPAWHSPVWSSQPWGAPFHNSGEDSLQPYVQFQQHFSGNDLEASLETVGENSKYLNTPQALDVLNYSVNMPPDGM
uniref:homeobox protein NANOG isoform X1 n=1 Tax=Jaculus jaculus TaxID=51337 RepID=UPI001E1B5E94|nr:homeobox protein NANOG isoform X1 [Jaculus jaculus]